MAMTSGQILAIDQLRAIEAASAGELEIVNVAEPTAERKCAVVTLSVFTGAMPRVETGLPLNERELLTVLVPADFPFVPPKLRVPHARFAGRPHVQWRCCICLYQSPSTEWSPADGMFGFIDRVDSWLRQGARDELDPMGAPLHPPVAYAGEGPTRTVIPRLDTPTVGSETWIGLVEAESAADCRVDLGRWLEVGEIPTSPLVAAAILLSEVMPFEYPKKMRTLIDQLAERSVPRSLLLSALRLAAVHNPDNTPLYVVLGTPMRGVRGSDNLKQHLAVWYLEPWTADALRLSIKKHSASEELRRIGNEVEGILLSWADEAALKWCDVREARAEVTMRRDEGSPLTWFRGKTVSVWGCGALGGAIAEMLVRAGAGRLLLHDKGAVAPGILARQPFDDADIGRPKAEALRDRLLRIRPKDLQVDARNVDLLDDPLADDDWTSGADIVIDASASNAVAAKLDLRRRTSGRRRVPVAAMIIGHNATRGLATLALPQHSSAPAGIDRRAKLASCNNPRLQAYRDEFWPAQARSMVFQPEPGCSETTFVGSAADTLALSGAMLNCIALDLTNSADRSAFSHFLTLPHAGAAEPCPPPISWVPDVELVDPQTGYAVRIADGAWRQMQAWIRTSGRQRGPEVETGGLLFGHGDDALRVFWIDEILGPPPDSECSADLFVCGVEGTKVADVEKRQRSSNSIGYVGMWHTHPNGDPLPSSTDLDGMRRLCAATDSDNARQLLIILGRTTSPTPSASAYVFSGRDFSRWNGGQFSRVCAISLAGSSPIATSRRVGLALSGGGSRAMAFHLGCLRALHDRGILSQVQVLSAVSGGAVIGAMYAFSNDSFEEFDRRVVATLRKGFLAGIAKECFLPSQLLGTLGTTLSAGALAIIVDLLRTTTAICGRLPLLKRTGLAKAAARLQPPLRRWFSRTSAFESTLVRQLFGDTLITGPRRDGLDIVVNACELQTTSAFRFGSRNSGSWRFGTIAGNQVPVATAVAASAAYPAFLPALDRVFDFVGKDGAVTTKRVILTDGGVYDNLGTSCLEPGRSDAFSTNVFHPSYIVCCDAGPGIYDGGVAPYWWPSRMKRAFEAVFRKAKDAGNSRLHLFRESKQLDGFILSYLGQQDHHLPYRPARLVSREDVCDYPTDFSPMESASIERLAARGEQLTRLLIDHYCPEL